MNIPNALSIMRLILVPVFVRVFFSGMPYAKAAAAGIFLLAGLTDMLDGRLARKYNQITVLGKILDPLADKVLICSVLIMFVELEWMQAWVAIVMICRELVVTGLRAMAIDEGIVLAADKFGKAKTVMQIAAIIPLMLHHPYGGVELWHIGEALMYVALALSLFSGANYCYGFYRTTANK